MNSEQTSPLLQWFDDNHGPHVNGKAKEAIELLSSLIVGVAFTSGILINNDDLRTTYLKLIRTAFDGLYGSGSGENFSEKMIADVYLHLTGENFADLQDEWAVDMAMAMAQNRALLGLD